MHNTGLSYANIRVNCCGTILPDKKSKTSIIAYWITYTYSDNFFHMYLSTFEKQSGFLMQYIRINTTIAYDPI